jgi:hypothetical protein
MCSTWLKAGDFFVGNALMLTKNHTCCHTSTSKHALRSWLQYSIRDYEMIQLCWSLIISGTTVAFFSLFVRRNVWRYQRGQNSLMAGQTTQWPKEKGQTTICKTLHIKLKIEHHWTQVSRKGIRSSCSTSGTRRATLDANSVISHERGKDQEVLALSGTYLWPFVTLIFRRGEQRHTGSGDRKTFEWWL